MAAGHANSTSEMIASQVDREAAPMGSGDRTFSHSLVGHHITVRPQGAPCSWLDDQLLRSPENVGRRGERSGSVKETNLNVEVVALSPTVLMATNRFMCEICMTMGPFFQKSSMILSKMREEKGR